MLKRRIYLDSAAAAKVSARARSAFVSALTHFGNPSSPHEEGRKAKEILEAARTSIARRIGVKSDAVIFTGSATEANGLATLGLIKKLKSSGHSGSLHILYLPTAHASVYENMQELNAYGVETELIHMQEDGIDLEAFRKQVRPETVLVCLELICGETGMRINPREVREILTHLKSKALIHVDASQAPLVELIERGRLSVDMLTLDASKIGAVRGLGVLVASQQVPLASLYEGGGQERGLRSGTQSPALAASFAEAFGDAQEEYEHFAKRAEALRTALYKGIQILYPEVLINEGREQAPHILNVSFPGLDTDYLCALLDAKGFAVSTKSACETDESGSRAVLAMSGDQNRAKSTLRISFGKETKDGEITGFVRALSQSLALLSKNRLQ